MTSLIIALIFQQAFVKVPRPANEGRGSFWSLAPDSEKDIFKRLLRQQNLSTISSTSTSRNIYHRISSSPTPITLSVPSSKPKQLCTVATQTYPASVHFDVSQSSLLSPSVSTPSPSPSPPLVILMKYVLFIMLQSGIKLVLNQLCIFSIQNKCISNVFVSASQ